jgi:hypothetical protein
MPNSAFDSIPAKHGFAITKNDSTDLTRVTRAVYVGGAGSVAAILQGDSTAVTFAGVIAGTFLPIKAKRINSTGTDATLMIGLY